MAKFRIYLVPESIAEEKVFCDLKLEYFKLDIKYPGKVVMHGRYECTEEQLPQIKAALEGISNV